MSKKPRTWVFIIKLITATSNDCHGISNYQPIECLLNSLFKLTTNIKGLHHCTFVWGIHQCIVDSPHKELVTWKMFPFDDTMICHCIHHCCCIHHFQEIVVDALTVVDAGPASTTVNASTTIYHYHHIYPFDCCNYHHIERLLVNMLQNPVFAESLQDLYWKNKSLQ